MRRRRRDVCVAHCTLATRRNATRASEGMLKSVSMCLGGQTARSSRRAFFIRLLNSSSAVAVYLLILCSEVRTSVSRRRRRERELCVRTHVDMVARRSGLLPAAAAAVCAHTHTCAHARTYSHTFRRPHGDADDAPRPPPFRLPVVVVADAVPHLQ